MSNKLNAKNLMAKGSVNINNNKIKDLATFSASFGYVE